MRSVSCVLLAAASIVLATNPRDAVVGGTRTLVVVEDREMAAAHSALLQQLRSDGHSLDIQMADTTDVSIEKFGEHVYDHIVLLAPGSEVPAGLDADQLTRYIDTGGSVLAVASEAASGTLREFASEIGVDIHPTQSAVIDHLSFDTADPTGQHQRVVTSGVASVAPLVGAELASKGSSARVLYQGVGLSADPDNLQVIRALVGESTTYSAMAGESAEVPLAAGADTLLVAAIQARNNARVVLVGSPFLLSDEAFTATVQSASAPDSAGQPSDNRALARALSRWCFQRAGVLRASGVRHTRADGSSPELLVSNKARPDLPDSMFPEPEIGRETRAYRIKDDLVFQVDLHQHAQGKDGSWQWTPFVADDVQLEFVMLDPYVRTNMTTDGSGAFTARFKAPDRHGIYKFRIMYRREGWSTVSVSEQVSVRPFRHNEYPRYLGQAMPYYATVFVLMAGFFVTLGLMLSTKDGGVVEAEKKSQ